jgi:hypothetical protein
MYDWRRVLGVGHTLEQLRVRHAYRLARVHVEARALTAFRPVTLRNLPRFKLDYGPAWALDAGQPGGLLHMLVRHLALERDLQHGNMAHHVVAVRQ